MYLGAGIGAAETDTSQTSYKLFGGFQFTPTWGLEIAYTDLSKYNGANFESASLAGTGTLPLDENWSLLGKLGASSNRSHFAGSSRHTDLLVGAGVGFKLSKNAGLRLEYEDFGKLSDNNPGNNSRGRNLSLDLKYSF
jgi:OOP family OmpA-OmpF porin